MCETGGSVENFLKSSQDNELSGSGTDNSEVMPSNMAMYGTQPITLSKETSVKTDAFVYAQKENSNPNANQQQIPSDRSGKSDISSSNVSEGSMIVQNLPQSKIVFATKKSLDKSSGLLIDYKPNKDRSKPSTGKMIKNRPTDYHQKQVVTEGFYPVGSSSESSSDSDESMHIEIEDEECLKNYLQNSQAKTTKAMHAKKGQKFGFGKLKQSQSKTRQQKFTKLPKSNLRSTSANMARKQAKELKNKQYKLRSAVESGDVNTVVSILQGHAKSSLNNIDSEVGKLQALVDILKQDLISKAYCNSIDMTGQDKWTLLHTAANESNLEMAKVLLEFGANPNSESSNLRTPLHIACLRGNFELTQMLIDHGAEVDVKDIDGNSPAGLCSEYGKLNISHSYQI